MKTQIIQCADRPRVQRHGQQLVITFTDESSRCECEINMTQGWALASDLMEIINSYKEDTALHPVMLDALRPWVTPR